MKSKIVLLKDLVNPNLQNYIYDICQKDLAYTYNPTTSPPLSFQKTNHHIQNNVYDDFILSCNIKNIFDNSNLTNYGKVNFNLAHSLFTPLYLALSHLFIKIKYEDIVRCHVNHQIPVYNNSNQNKHNTPHLDFPNLKDPCFTLIYYVNDSDGDTVFFDEDLNIKKKITPKMGNMVLFNGNSPHAASHPIKSHRYIISYTFLYKNFK